MKSLFLITVAVSTLLLSACTKEYSAREMRADPKKLAETIKNCNERKLDGNSATCKDAYAIDRQQTINAASSLVTQ
ncbi:EexN family lipoprotein [Moraxella marmotae]|uniref:EexN family lipoprotein n=1 Tax=Moraxella marmotae TaxID=3344520 RepID=UPI0035F39A05